MTDACPTIRKVVLPVPLLDRVQTYLRECGITVCKARDLAALCMDNLDGFDTRAVRLEGTGGYRDFLSSVFSAHTRPVTLFFNRTNWERLCAPQIQYNIGAGDIVRLVLASCIFTSGSSILPLSELAEIFISGKQQYQYNTFLTSPVADGLARVGKELPAGRETLIRGSHYYYAKGIGTLPEHIPEEQYRVNGGTTGWSRLTVSGSLRMRDYFMERKKQTGKPLSVVMAHTVCSFLSALRGEAPHEQ